MQPKYFITAIVFALFLSCICLGYSGGSGTSADRYQISVVADWQELMATSGDLDKHFILTADLDLHGVALAPVGAFAGVFDGQGFTLRNVSIDLPARNYVGLFRSLRSGGEVRELGVEDVNITGEQYVGGLVGRTGGTLTSCYAAGDVTGDHRVGGLVGHNNGTLTSCYAAGDVTGDRNVGGLAGENLGTLTCCYAMGQVTGEWYVGGLVGENGHSLYYNLYGTLTSCYAAAQVTAGWRYVGGLVGYNSGMLTGCYATGQVSGLDVGGLVGFHDDGSYTSCFWDSDVNPDVDGVGNIADDPNVIGETTTKMRRESTFTEVGWDFVGIWDIRENQTYPFLREYSPGDVNHDDKVNFLDLAILADNWLAGK